jgi:hypothetical protein
MKKLLVIMLTMTMTLGLAGCDLIGGGGDVDPGNLPEVCDDGYELTENGCELIDPLTCPTGYEPDAAGENCVEITVDTTCPTGQVWNTTNEACEVDTTCPTGEVWNDSSSSCEVNTTCPTGEVWMNNACQTIPACSAGYILNTTTNSCEIDPNYVTNAELLAQTVVAAMRENPMLLPATVAQMDFSEALKFTIDFNFELAEEGNSTKYVDVQIIDSYVYADTGDTMKREITLDINDEQTFEFDMIFVEVDKGVHVYIQPELILDQIATDYDEFGEPIVDTDTALVLEIIGFDKEWALFQFDDTLENVVEIEVLKTMLIELFFSEVGEDVFDIAQADLEMAIGFDLNQYGVDFGAVMDELIEEDYAAAEVLLEGIDQDMIVLHFDQLYLAPRLYQLFMEHSTELTAASFDMTKLSTLDTATWDAEFEMTYDPDGIADSGDEEYRGFYVIDTFVNTDELDPTLGTEMFFDSLTETEKQTLVDVVIKPMIEMVAYDIVMENLDPVDLEDNFMNHLGDNHIEVLNYFTNETDIDDIILEVETVGILTYWENLSQADKEFYYDLTAEYSDWFYQDVIYEIEARIAWEDDFIQYLSDNRTELETMGYDLTGILDTTTPLLDWVELEGVALVEIYFDEYVYDVLADFETAYDQGEALEFITEAIFTNPEVIAAIPNLAGNPLLDETILAANMLALDYDALLTETVDFDLLTDAIYEGQTEYDTFVATLTTAAPNYQKVLELFSPGVASIEPFMIYMDDMMYAMDGLVVFEDYLDPQFYTDENIMDMEFDYNDDFEVEVDFTLGGEELQNLFVNLEEDVNSYLSGFGTLPFPFDSDWSCITDTTDPNYDEFCEDLDPTIISMMLLTLGDIDGRISYNPSNLHWMNVNLNATDLFNQLVSMDYLSVSSEEGYTPDTEYPRVTGINNLELNINIEDTATITIPAATVTSDVNQVAYDLSKFAIVMTGAEYMEKTADYFLENYTEQQLIDMFLAETAPSLSYTLQELQDMGYMNFSKAFDLEASTISLSADFSINPLDILNPTFNGIDYELDLVWLDGTNVFTDVLAASDFITYFVNDELVTRTAYESLIGEIDDTNFHMTKMFLMFMWEEDYNTETQVPQ